MNIALVRSSCVKHGLFSGILYNLLLTHITISITAMAKLRLTQAPVGAYHFVRRASFKANHMNGLLPIRVLIVVAFPKYSNIAWSATEFKRLVISLDAQSKSKVIILQSSIWPKTSNCKGNGVQVAISIPQVLLMLPRIVGLVLTCALPVCLGKAS